MLKRISWTRAGWIALAANWMTLSANWAALAQSASPPAGQATLQRSLEAIAAGHHGKVAFYAAKVDGTGQGAKVGLHPDEPVQTASVIKLALLYHAMTEVRAGRAHWEEPITLKPGEAVGGSGILHFFDTPLRVTLKDVLTMMVIVSDNTATNLVIDRFGIEPVNTQMEALGLDNTHLYKKVFKPAEGHLPPDQPRFGLGKTTAREMATLMADIGLCRLRSETAPGGAAKLRLLPMDDEDRKVCAVTLDMLKNQFYRDTVPRYLESVDTHGPAIASKTGSLDAVRNDVALVASKSGPMVFSMFTYDNADHSWTVDNEGELTIAKLARAIVEAWAPEGLDGRLLVPGLGLPGAASATEPVRK